MDAQADNQIDDPNDTEIEDEEFKCCVCLELIYKPVVLACGHICCFWCVFHTMNSFAESNCPICRHPYNHFPNVCGLLHYVIQTLYPIAYMKRELQVAEEEKEDGYSSPQIPENKFAFPPIENSTKYGVSPSTGKEDPSCSADISKIKNSVASTSGSKHVKDSSEAADSYHHKALKKLFSVDFPCPTCKKMLFRPVVLNCGHVHCEHCLTNIQNDILTCQVCESPNPNGMPKICLVVDHLIAQYFQELYGQRRDSLPEQAGSANEDPSNTVTQTSERTIKSEDYALWWTARGPKVHIEVGCDYCGMSPIIGERYKCKDCKEKIGFDLCETCYARSSVLPGRFNQQHKSDHRFELKQPHIFNHVFIRHELGESDDEDDYSSHDAQDDTTNDDGLPRTNVPDAHDTANDGGLPRTDDLDAPPPS